MNPWQKAIDQQRIVAHIGVAADGVSDEEASRQLAELIDWHVKVATDPAVNGGHVLVRVDDLVALTKFARAALEILGPIQPAKEVI